MELLAFGKTGWGDELFYATLMTVAVSVTAMLVGFFFALIFTPLKLSKYKTLNLVGNFYTTCLLYTSPSPRDVEESRMPSSA